jgi:hypothetical protein
VNRTHAYVFNGAGINAARAARRLSDWRTPPKRRGSNGYHVDYLIGEMIHDGFLVAYGCDPWICGQTEGLSDTTDRVKKAENWNG